MPDHNATRLNGYYKFHSWIYDSTRWTFLFGRKQLQDFIPFQENDSFRLLEVGCGTGAVIQHLRKHFPNSQLTGLDLSADMLQIARKKVGTDANTFLIQQAFGTDFTSKHNYDVILMSYSLSMVRNQWDAIGEAVSNHLLPGGYFVVLDFWSSKHQWFKQWMRYNHVYMEASTPLVLETDFYQELISVHPAYGGWWNYYYGRWKKH